MSLYNITDFADRVTIDGSNTSHTSDQIDFSRFTRLWVQNSGTADSAADVSCQLQVSNDALSVPAAKSSWVDEGSATQITSGDAGVFKYSGVGASKVRMVVTRSAGAITLTLRGVGKGS